jgi:hypothetical protein
MLLPSRSIHVSAPLQVAKCDVYNGSELARHLEGCEAVVSCLGVRGFNWPWSTVTLYSDTIKVSPPTIEIMKINGKA